MNLPARFTFNSIGKGFTMRMPLEMLSGRDKVALFQALMDDLGITDRLLAAPDETACAQAIIEEQGAKHWG